MKPSAINTDKDPADHNNVKERDYFASDFRSSQPNNNNPNSLPQQHGTEVATDVAGSLGNRQEQQQQIATNNGVERDHDGINHDEDDQIDGSNSSNSNKSNEINSNNNDNDHNNINNDSDYSNQYEDDNKASADDDESDEDSDTNDSSDNIDDYLNHEQHPDHENSRNRNRMISSIDRSDESFSFQFYDCYPLPGSQLHSILVHDDVDRIISEKDDNQQRQPSSLPSAVPNGISTTHSISHRSKPGTPGHLPDRERSEKQKNAMMKAVNVVQPLSTTDGPTYKDQVSQRRRDILQEHRQQQPNQPHQEQQKEPPQREQSKAAEMMKHEQKDQRKEPASTFRSGSSNDSDDEKNQEKNLRHRIQMIARNDNINRHDESHCTSHQTSSQEQEEENDEERGYADGSMENPQVVVLEAFVVDSIIVDAEPMPVPDPKDSHTSRHKNRRSSDGGVIYEVDEDDDSSKEYNSDEDDDNYRSCSLCCYRGHRRRNPRIQHVRVDVRWYRLLSVVFMFVVVCIIVIIISNIISAIFG